MKKFVFALAALFAFTATSAQAASDQGVKLGLGGYYKAGIGFIASDDDGATNPQADNRRGHAIKQDVEVWFTGETTLDNGLTVGARVELEGQTNSDQVDETWMYIKGSFGEVRVGDEDDARRLKSVVAPTASNIFKANDPGNDALSFSNNPLAFANGLVPNNTIGINSTAMNVENDSTKLIYMTPSFNGFSLAVSYAPDASKSGSNNGGLTPTDNTAGQNSKAYSIAGSYDGKFDNVKVQASLGYTGSNNEGTGAGNDDVDAWQAGLGVGFGAFNVGGSYGVLKNALNTGRGDVSTYELGGTYGTGPYTVGLNWSRGKYEFSNTQEPELNTFMVSGSYAMGPGITLDAAVSYDQYDNDGNTAISAGNATADYDSTSIMVGSSIKF
jgi:outer membrane protein OmpU